MNKLRAILIGALIWLLIFISFVILAFFPSINNSLNKQTLIVCALIVPFTILGSAIYYKNGNKENGFKIGVIMAITALILDALITVPFIEIPKGGSYKSFYAFPLLWLLVFINVITVFWYWKLKIVSNRSK